MVEGKIPGEAVPFPLPPKKKTKIKILCQNNAFLCKIFTQFEIHPIKKRPLNPYLALPLQKFTQRHAMNAAQAAIWHFHLYLLQNLNN